MLKASRLLAVLLAASLSAQSAVTITDGNCTYSYSSYPTTRTSAAGLNNFTANGADHMYQNWWYYYLAPDTTGSAFNTSGGQMTATVAADGRSVAFDWANVDGRNIAARLVNCVYSTGPSTGITAQCLCITNNTGGSITIYIYNYLDLDVAGSTSNVAAQDPNLPAGNHIVTNTTANRSLYYNALNFNAYEVRAFAGLRTSILAGSGGSFYQPTNTGLPFGPGDYTGCFFWCVTIPANGSAWFYELISDGVSSPSQGLATTTNYCVAKPGTNGLPAWSLNRAFIGGTMNLQINNGLNGSPPIAALGTGQVNIPFPPIGTICVNPIITTIGMPPFASGTSALPLPIPGNGGLAGLNLYFQGFFIDAGAAGSIAHTDGLCVTLGNYYGN